MAYGVDPAELHSAAGRVGVARLAAGEAYQLLGRSGDPSAWCAEAAVVSVIRQAVERLTWAAQEAGHRADLVAVALAAAATGYHDADSPAPR